MKKSMLAVIVVVVFVFFGCKTNYMYQETLDVNGKIVSRTMTYDADKLASKGVAFGGTVEGAKIETDLSMSSGSPTPLPKFAGGFFSFFWIDAPVQTGGIYYNWTKSLWSDKPASVTFIRFGSTQKASMINIKNQPTNLIDVPMFTVQNPFSPNNFSIDITPDASVDSGVAVDSGNKLPLIISVPSVNTKVDTGLNVDTGKK